MDEFQKNKQDAFIEWAYNRELSSLPFDLNAQNPEAFNKLAEIAPAVKILSAGGGELFQAEGYIGEYCFYLRSEWVMGEAVDGSLDKAYSILKVAADSENVHLSPSWTAENSSETNLDNLEEALVELISQLDIASHAWVFSVHPIKTTNGSWDRTVEGFLQTDFSKTVEEVASGRSQEEALADLLSPILSLLEKKNITLEQWNHYRREAIFSPVGELLYPEADVARNNLDWVAVAKGF